MTGIHPLAGFDSLFIVSRLHHRDYGVAPQELHTFAYLSCLLALYRESPVSDWGYEFVGTDLGAPFSMDIDYAVDQYLERGLLYQKNGLLFWIESTANILDPLANLEIHRNRIPCLDAACSSATVLSIGMVATALTKEPELERVRNMGGRRILLQNDRRQCLYDQFSVLRGALTKSSDDLRLPAFVWLSALYQLESPGLSTPC